MSWITEMKKGLDRMWDGLVRDKMRQEGVLRDLAPKWYSVLIWLIVFLLVCVNPLKGQQRPEIVPYRLVPSSDYGYGCWLEIEIVEPVKAQNTYLIHREEVIDIVKERAAYEEINPMERSQIFSIDDKTYYLVRIPYTFDSSSWIDKDTKYGKE